MTSFELWFGIALPAAIATGAWLYVRATEKRESRR